MYFGCKDLKNNKRLQMAHDFNTVHPNCRAIFLVEVKNPCIAFTEIRRTTQM